MKIPHLKSDGSFRPQIRDGLQKLKSAAEITVPLYPAGGYSGAVNITIGRRNEDEFEADVSTNDWTRFPARIRAAATELRDQGFTGDFHVRHAERELSVAKGHRPTAPLRAAAATHLA